MTDAPPDERPQRRREYSGAASTLGVAAVVMLLVGIALWYFQFSDDSPTAAGGTGDSFGVVALGDSLNPTGEPPAAQQGRAAPNFRLPDLQGEPATLDGFRGRFVVLNFWASWCGPCKSETPALQRLFEAEGPERLVVVGVNQQETEDAARSFTQRFGVTYPIVLDSDGEVSDAYRATSLPMTFLVDPDGVVREVHFGELTEEQMRSWAQEYLD